MRGLLPVLLVSVCICSSYSSAAADFVGLDRNGDRICDEEDMGIAGAAVGETIEFDVYFDDFADPNFLACAFCVQDKEMVEDPEFVFDIPGAWLEYMFIDTEIDGPGEDYPSDWILAAYPNARCWLAAAFAEPPSYQVLPLPGRIGFFRIRAARDGCIGFVLDGANCYWQRWGGGSGTFEDPGETCPPFPCDGPSAVRKDCWGSLKRMFR